MSTPHRPVLAGALALIALLAGCLGAPGAPVADGTVPTAHPGSDVPTSTSRSETAAASRTAPDYEAYVFDHAGIENPVVEGGIGYPAGGEYVGSNYVAIVASRDEADRFRLRGVDEGAASFVADTSFDRSYLVVFQEFPVSSSPDYRVERVETGGGEVRLTVNDSSHGATSDITVETVLVRVRGETPERATVTTETGDTFSSADGVRTRTPRPTPTPDAGELPYRSSNDSENVDDPRDVRIENAGERTNGYRIAVTYVDRPACLAETPPCGQPTREIAVLEEREKLPAGASRTIEDVAAREGTYRVSVEATVPAANGSRRTVATAFEWRVEAGRGDAVVTITDGNVSARQEAGSGTAATPPQLRHS